ncbi:MAG: hypothetical protein RML56_05200 [Burkholderiales bacterium]|nr:hypothetical protein [Burkholderiales bacterium]
MRAFSRWTAAFALALAGAVPLGAHAADPVLMLLFGIAREMVISHALQQPSRAPREASAPVDVYPGTTVTPAQLRRLIDECFGYLSQAQREEIFAALHAAILEPRHAAIRASLIGYFAERALAVRALGERLAQLSAREKERIVEEFRAELGAMPAERRSELGEALRKRLLPVPEDLGQMLLAALER